MTQVHLAVAYLGQRAFFWLYGYPALNVRILHQAGNTGYLTDGRSLNRHASLVVTVELHNMYMCMRMHMHVMLLL